MVIFSLIQYHYTTEGKTLTSMFWKYELSARQPNIVEIDADCEIIGSHASYSLYFTTLSFSGISQLKKINDSAFQNKNLKKFEFEKCPLLEEIGANAFAKCNIKILDLSFCRNLKLIKENSFDESEIEILSLPSSIVELGEGAFGYCYNLREINIPSDINLIKIPNLLFAKTKISSFTITAKVADIQMGAFNGCPLLKDIYFDETNQNIVRRNDCLFSSDLNKIIAIYPNVTEVILPLTLEEIGIYSFSNSYLKSIVIPSTAKKIRKYAFYTAKINEIVFQDDSQLEIIEEFALATISELKLNLSLLKKLSTIESYALFSCNPIVFREMIYLKRFIQHSVI